MPKEKLPVGRPPIEIDWIEFDKLLGIQATKEEIAGWFNCSLETVENKVMEKFGLNFSGYKAQKGSAGKISLRRKQYQTAMSGNVSMLIWLGKQWLKQTDKIEIDSQGPNDPRKPELTDKSDEELDAMIIEAPCLLPPP